MLQRLALAANLLWLGSLILVVAFNWPHANSTDLALAAAAISTMALNTAVLWRNALFPVRDKRERLEEEIKIEKLKRELAEVRGGDHT